MRILDRYIFREILSSSLLGMALATAIIFLQVVGKLFEVLVRSSPRLETTLYLFALSLPPLLPLTIPFGALVGILVGLGRMATDGEITAMRAAGCSSRRVVPAVMFFAFIAMLVSGAMTLRLTPLSVRISKDLLEKISASQVSADIQPRVFDEQFPNTILYVGDVKPGTVVLWRNVFLADLTPPEQRTNGMRDKADGPLITVAQEAIAVPDPVNNRLQLTMRNAGNHEMGKDLKGYDSFSPVVAQALYAAPPEQVARKPFSEMNTRELRRYITHGPDWIEARIEFDRRLALPVGCLVLALVGIPLGVSSRKGGKSGGYVTAVFLAFFCYWLFFISLVRLARQKALPVDLALWLPNLVFLVAGLIFLARMEKPGGSDLVAAITDAFTAAVNALRKRLVKERGAAPRRAWHLPLLPQILDTYILSKFLFYFVLVLASFVSMTQVYNFFELLGDIVANNISLAKVFTYLFFLTPKLIYETLPISVLVGVLVTFGVLTKHNEVTAFKACGISLHRLAIPILVISTFLSGGLFAFDHYYVPEANRRQDALRNEIKGRAVQTYLSPERKWIFGRGSRIYYYKFFDQTESMMGGVIVYEVDPNTFQLVRQISAERAHWQPSLKTWVFENGWQREFHANRSVPLTSFQVQTFAELNEPPSYFLKEVKQDSQMNSRELDGYINDLQQSGFNTVRLRVQFYRKFSVPLFALIMAMISIPFGFLVGNRGAMAGIGVSIGIAITYWGIGLLFEKIGDVNQLPPAIAAWSPDALFSLTGLYLLLRMRS